MCLRVPVEADLKWSDSRHGFSCGGEESCKNSELASWTLKSSR